MTKEDYELLTALQEQYEAEVVEQLQEQCHECTEEYYDEEEDWHDEEADTGSATGTDSILANRATQYGEYKDVAAIAQTIKSTLYTQMQGTVPTFALESIDMIANKLARIACGNPLNKDSWDDIAGYATLVSNELENFPGAIHTDVEYRQNA